MIIRGGPMPYAKKQVVETARCACGDTHEHTVDVFDVDAYWSLDYLGNEDPDGGFLYFKVAFPRLADAQRLHQIERQAAQDRHSRTLRRPRPRRVQR